jgi:Transcriptional antiterminator
MMRQAKIIKYLVEQQEERTKEQFAKQLNVSLRTITTDVKQINESALKHGFQICSQHGAGYRLDISNQAAFDAYYQQIVRTLPTYLTPKERQVNLLLLLLFNRTYVTLHQMAERVFVSESTIKNDLQPMKARLQENELSLYGKPYYGYKVVGSEERRRGLIAQLLRQTFSKPKITQEYAEFLEDFDEKGLRQFLIQRIQQYEIQINDPVLENILLHVLLLSFRMKQGKFIQSEVVPLTEEDSIVQLTRDLCRYLQERENVYLPRNERLYLCQQLHGKMLVIHEFTQYEQLCTYIEQALQAVDARYQTNFHADGELQEALALHMAPLLQRLYTGHQLENPMIEDVYTRYANVFTITYEFVQLIAQPIQQAISKDEMGYLAIYFAASLEKQAQKEITRYKKIAVICATGGGASYFLKTKLEQIFTNAQVATYSLIEVEQIGTVDLIISTVPTEIEAAQAPVIHTQALLTEKEINKIQQDLLLIQESQAGSVTLAQRLECLFSEKNFLITDERDYLQLLKTRAERLEQTGQAKIGYAQLVLQRETLVNTIYQQGIAGPHAMEARALVEGIDVILVKPTMTYQEKSVQLIFLINISQGHLFLHKEISQLMIQMMDDPNFEKQVATMQTYTDFMRYVREIIQKG